MTTVTRDDLTGYLRRIGVADPGSPSVEGLYALARAHVERVPFENLDIQLGRPPGIDPALSVRRIAAGHGGYCFHLNGAFAALLEGLGYDVTRHLGGMHADPEARDAGGDHLALTVRVGGREHFVDVGMGDGPLEPLPLRAGAYEQGFAYRLEPLAVTWDEGASEGDGWSLRRDGVPTPRMNFRSAPASMAGFEPAHRWLSTAEESPFRQSFVMLRRTGRGIDRLHGRMLIHTAVDGARTVRELTGADEFYGAVEEVFGRALDDVTPEDRAALWDRVTRAHEAWRAAQAAPAAAAAG
ncbi:arylamine N-acetyltransferase [Streptomyces sp. Ag109_G2-6]|uniref:arylamine N-acetyltransferase family protein n=1 Tax=Streptomyces sp. Ag109_G2-6 TaxID=2485154 RepID=UPI000C2CDC88|nr:arylamine N-acetyltransferase [Streptomyces sp. Ag109_G2-6]RPF41285.1 arylamine N-acetyltransferase [Streptomyces sp. Ag109_G2-6]